MCIPIEAEALFVENSVPNINMDSVCIRIGLEDRTYFSPLMSDRIRHHYP